MLEFLSFIFWQMSSSNQNVNEMAKMINYDNEIGTPSKPPKLVKGVDFTNWKDRLDTFILYNDTSILKPIQVGYVERTSIAGDRYTRIKKHALAYTDEEKKEYDRERKTYATINMGLTTEIRHNFSQLRLKSW